MSFTPPLREIVLGCGGIGIVLMGNDGVPIEQVMAPLPDDPHARDWSEDVSTAGIEFGRILEEVRKASDAVAGGAPVESVFSLSRFTLILRPVDEETFLALALAPDGNLGKARYLIRRYLPAIRREL